MKKLYGILGLSLSLTSCFDEPQPEKAVVKETAAEKPAVTIIPPSAEAEKVEAKIEEVKKEAQEQMIPKAENVTFEPEMAKETKLVEAPLTPQDKPTDAELWNQAEKAATAANAQQLLAKKVKPNAAKKLARKKTKAKTTVSNATYYDENGLSPEEQRVGAQQVMSAAELKALKYKCRYPLMSPQERVEYHCEVKPVTLK